MTEDLKNIAELLQTNKDNNQAQKAAWAGADDTQKVALVNSGEITLIQLLMEGIDSGTAAVKKACKKAIQKQLINNAAHIKTFIETVSDLGPQIAAKLKQYAPGLELSELPLDERILFDAYGLQIEGLQRTLVAYAKTAIPELNDLPANTTRIELISRLQTLRPEWELTGQTPAIEIHSFLLKEIQQQLEVRLTRAPIGDLINQPYIAIPSGTPCYDVSYAIARGKEFFTIGESGWPHARIEREQSVTSIEIKPEEARMWQSEEQRIFSQNRMAEHLDEMSDLDADMMDGLMAIWIKSAKTPNDQVVINIDDILDLRGLKKNISGNGRRGGYQASQRLEHLKAAFRLENIWIQFDGPPPSKGRKERDIVWSRAINIRDIAGKQRIDGRVDIRSFLFQPGHVYGRYLMTEGRQTALLNAKALRYDPYRQGPEKRLTRYLAWQWRIRSREGNYSTPFSVTTLLVEANIPQNRPERAKQRLESALDQLETDGIINSFAFIGWDEERESEGRDRLARGWWDRYLGAKVRIEPPDVIQDHYAHLERGRPVKQRLALKEAATIGKQLATRRKNLRLSQAVIAETLGITQARLSQIERGKAKVSQSLRKKIEDWLSS